MSKKITKNDSRSQFRKKKKPIKKRTKQGKFIEGYSGNPNGRPKGAKNHDGLGAVLNMFKDLVSKEKNLKITKEALQEEMNHNPTKFFYKYTMPLFPKNVNLESDSISIIISDMLSPHKQSNKNRKGE